MTKRSYAILGTGALGGYYGALLHHAGHDVHFLLRSDYDHIKANGLRVDSPHGDHRLADVQAYERATRMPRCDVVVVAVKTTHNHLLPELLPSVVKDDGVVLVLQNGLSPEAETASVIGEQRVVGGLCFLCSNKVGPGHIRHLAYGRIALGEHAATGVSERMQAIANDFAPTGVPITLSEDLKLARWQKLVWNVPYNGLSVALDARTDELMAHEPTRAMVVALMEEVVAAAEAVDDRVIEPAFVEKMLDDTEKMTPYHTSMKLDFDAGRPMETESILGDPVRAAEAAGRDVPMMAALYRQLLAMERQRVGV